MSAEVVQIYETNLRDVAASLRKLADEIEAGRYGEVGSCGVVILGDTMEVFGSGDDSSGPSIITLFQAGIMRLAAEVERHGRG